jgi:hypothetical protein
MHLQAHWGGPPCPPLRKCHRTPAQCLAAIQAGDRLRERQYLFEQVCLKSLYNETPARDPFDLDSPHWIIKCAIGLARQVGMPVREVIAVVAPES